MYISERMETRTLTLPSPQPQPYFTTLSYVLNDKIPRTDVQLRTKVDIHDVVVAFKKSDFHGKTGIAHQMEKYLTWKLFSLQLKQLDTISLLEIKFLQNKRFANILWLYHLRKLLYGLYAPRYNDGIMN